MNGFSKQVILNILEAIDYKDNREKFADEFIKLIQMQALNDLIQALPHQRQVDAKRDFAAVDSEEKVKVTIEKYYTEEQLNDAIENAAKNAVIEWIQTVQPTLTGEQISRLQSLSQELRQASQ